MTITIINEAHKLEEFDEETVAEEVILCALDFQEFPYEAEVNVTLVDEESIQEINHEMRGIHKVTDVLSFPLITYEQAGDFSNLEDTEDNFNPDTGEALLGDIVICIPRMQEQAMEYGHSLKREYAFLIAHSMLHLMGYDHMTDREETEMFTRQEKILERLSINRR
ncbi:MAG: rRNA maturation RNase YbeY [Lachnospiraceae bacterium]